MKHLIPFLLFSVSASQLFSSEIISAARRTTWQSNVGVQGGIPKVTTVFTNLSPLPNKDDSIQINLALSQCPSNQAVVLTNLQFNLSNSISYENLNNGIVLRGRGSNTVLKGWNSSTYGQIYLGGRANGNISDAGIVSSPVTNVLAQGDTNLLVTTPGLFTVGEVWLLCHTNDVDVAGTNVEGNATAGYSPYPGNYWRGQSVEIKSKVNTNLTVSSPLMFPFTNAPKLVKYINTYQKMSGIENLTLDMSPQTDQNISAIVFEGAVNCWASNVWVLSPPKNAIMNWYSFRTEVRHCYFKGNGTQYPAGGGYGFANYFGSGNSLCEDNIFYLMHSAMDSQYYCAGDAFAYNFETNGVSASGSSPSFGTHGVHTMQNLIEGNWFYDMILFDYTHGSGDRHTVFRNVIKGYDGSPTWLNNPVNLYNHNRHVNLVGNILGRAGFSTNYIYHTGNFGSIPDKNLYGVFYMGAYGGGSGGADEDLASLNAIIHLNYTTATTTNSGLQVDVSNAGTLNDSYLYSSTPGIFSGTILSWPPFNPSNVTAASTSPTNIPAGYRFVFGVEVPASGPDTTPPTISGVTVTGITTSGATVNGNADETATFGIDFKLTSTTTYTSLTNGPGTSFSQPLTGLPAATIYDYRVRAWDAAGNISTNTPAQFTTSSPGGIAAYFPVGGADGYIGL